MKLPEELSAYLKSGKSLYGDIPQIELYLVLWPEAEIEQFNASYGVETYAPGFCGIGSDGGGEMIAIGPEGKIYAIPFIGMAPAEARPIANSWIEFEAMIVEPD